MKRFTHILFMFTAVVAVAGCGGGESGNANKPKPPLAMPGQLSLFYTCDTRGNLDPCRCTSGIAGGMARRATFLKQAKKSLHNPFLLVDAGNLAGGGRDWELLELKHAVRAYVEMEYFAVNLGVRELSVGYGALRDLGYLRFVSSNVVTEVGKPVVHPTQLWDVGNGFTVGILGVVDDSYPVTGEGLKVLPPAEAIAKYLPEVTKEAHLVVLLAFMDHEGMTALAEQFFEIDIIIGGDVPQPTAEPKQVNQSIIVANTDKGKAVGQLDLVFPGGEVAVLENEIAILLDDVPDDPGMVEMIQEFHIERLDKGFPDRRDMDEELNVVGAS
jgi:2',3'-cyclic-nucleotide 2'-phosphodiesterase (5'-nucleotidase family)